MLSRLSNVRVTTWDRRVAERAAAFSCIAFLLAWLITAATDEGGVPWGIRAGRTMPLTPLCAAIGAWLALFGPNARGEVRALMALGRGPFEVAAAACVGASFVALGSAIVLATVPAVDIAGFFPAVAHGPEYFYGNEGFVERNTGVVILSDGSFGFRTDLPTFAEGKTVLPRFARLSAALATALSGVALPFMIVDVGLLGDRSRRAVWRAFGVVMVSVVASIVLFHLAAVRRVSALTTALPAVGLLWASLWRYRARTPV